MVATLHHSFTFFEIDGWEDGRLHQNDLIIFCHSWYSFRISQLSCHI